MISTADNLTSQILKINVDQLKKVSKGRRALDPESIHDMRVATRRLRAALKTFKTVFPSRAQELRKELQKLARLLGKKRDLDVFLAFIFKTLDAKLADFPQLAKQLAQAKKPILAIFKSARFANLMKELEHLQPTKSYNLCKFAKRQIRKATKRVLDPKADQELHILRIRLKKLRYTCEFFTSLFSLDKWIEKTIKVQDLLGEHQDAIIGISILKRYQDQFSSIQYQKAKDCLKSQQKSRRRSFVKIWKRYSDRAEKAIL